MKTEGINPVTTETKVKTGKRQREADWAWAEAMNRNRERLEYARLFGEAAHPIV